jgi:tRNA-splicing ligase RtcB (3'-phosphate/5'-hydroxy nucleic acid ligase)
MNISHVSSPILSVRPCKIQKAQAQLGTVGSGNHYVDLKRDGDDHVWIGVIFGSRGLVHSTATKCLKLAEGKDGMNVPPTILDAKSDLGRAYLAGMELGSLYAYAGREWVVERVRKIVGGEVAESVHNHHDFAWLEQHNSEQLWVVRKGATPRQPRLRSLEENARATWANPAVPQRLY